MIVMITGNGNPDWLPVEIDANILIRHNQVVVALSTEFPASGFK